MQRHTIITAMAAVLMLSLCLMAVIPSESRADGSEWVKISNAAELINIGATGNYILTAHINMENQTFAKQLNFDFQGEINGNGYTIYNLYFGRELTAGGSSAENYIGGLFGKITGATVTNLSLVFTGIDVTVRQNQGSIYVGFIAGIADNSKLHNINIIKASGYTYAGVIFPTTSSKILMSASVGQMANSTVDNVSIIHAGALSMSGTSAGHIAPYGEIDGNTQISNCYAGIYKISINDGQIPFIDGFTNRTVYDCYYTMGLEYVRSTVSSAELIPWNSKSLESNYGNLNIDKWEIGPLGHPQISQLAMTDHISDPDYEPIIVIPGLDDPIVINTDSKNAIIVIAGLLLVTGLWTRHPAVLLIGGIALMAGLLVNGVI